MSNPATSDVSTVTDREWVWLRLEQDFPFLGTEAAREDHEFAWITLLSVVVGIGLIYVLIYYIKEMRATGWHTWFNSKVVGLLGKANPLGLLNLFRIPGAYLMLMRISVYALLGAVFLLPAWRTTTTHTPPPTVRKSKVIVLVAVSDSETQLRDQLPKEGETLLDVPTRQDKIFNQLITKNEFQFLKDLSNPETGNPVVLHRFAHSLDPEYRYLNNGKYWPREVWESRSNLLAAAARKKEAGEDPDLAPEIENGLDLKPADWERWLYPRKASTKDPKWVEDNPDLLELPEAWRRKLVNHNVELLARNFTRATSVEQVVLQTLRRERGNLVEGIIVITDGKTVSQTQDQAEEVARREALKDVQKLSRDQGVPILVVGVGENRRTVSTSIADLRAPGQIQPEDKFPVEFVVEGIGREKEEFPVTLELVRVKRIETPDGEEKFEERDIILEPLGESGQVLKDVPTVNLGKWLTLRPTFRLNEGTDEDPLAVPVFNQRTNEGPTPIKEFPKFLKGSPPSAQIELQVTTRLLAQKLINEANSAARRQQLLNKAQVVRNQATTEGDEDVKKRLLKQAEDLEMLAKDVGSITRDLRARIKELNEKKEKGGLSPKDEAKLDAEVNALDARIKDIEVKATKAGLDYKPGQKYGIQPDPDSTLRFRVHVPKDKRELDVTEDHRSLPVDVRVLKKPVRVLLFASVATREYRFLRTLFVREAEKKRAEVCIHIQPIPGTQPRSGIVQDVPKERLLKTFPQKRKKPDGVTEPEAFNYLDQYDVIIAFDPDWRYLAENSEGLQLSSETYRERNQKVLENLHDWVAKDGGGLILMGAKLNMVYLNDPSVVKSQFMKPIHDLLPVVVDYKTLTDSEWRDPIKPNQLELSALSPEWEFMRLEEDNPDVDAREAWKRFFLEQELDDGSKNLIDPTKQPLERGFYSYIPISRVKKGKVNVVARFVDPDHMVQDEATGRMEHQPYIVLREYDKGRVTWLGSGELWRLRTYKEKFHERFWTKLARYTGSGSHSGASKTIIPVLGRYGKLRQKTTFEAQFETSDGDPLPANLDKVDLPRMHVSLPPGGKAIEVDDYVQLRDEIGSRLNGKAGKVVRTYRKDKSDWIDVELIPDDEAQRNDPDFKRKVASIEAIKATIFVPTLVFEPQKDKGWFEVKFEPTMPGRHVLELENPKTNEKYRHVFFVQDPNPELVHRAPALDQLFYLASEADVATTKLTNPDKRLEIERGLKKPDFASIDAEGDGPTKDELALRRTNRLYFDLDTANVIPSLLRKHVETDQERFQKVEEDPIWDRGFVVFWEDTSWGGYPRFEDSSPREDEDTISYVLVGIVLLLTMEWMARKLLRLA